MGWVALGWGPPMSVWRAAVWEEYWEEESGGVWEEMLGREPPDRSIEEVEVLRK